MTPLTIAGRPTSLVTLSLREPVDGAWLAEVSIKESPGATPAPGAACELGAFRGSVASVIVDRGVVRMLLVGGLGNLGEPLAPQYHAIPRSAVAFLDVLASEAAETPGDAPDVLLPSWRTLGGSYRFETQRLARTLGLPWRVAPGGGVSLVAPTWAAAPAPGKRVAAGVSWVDYACDAVAPLAGFAVDGRRVMVAQWELAAGRLAVTLTTSAEPAAEPRSVVRTAAVLAQSGQRLDLETDDGVTVLGVPLWLGVPGLEVDLPAGARVMLLDLGDDPRQTAAMLAPSGELAATAVRLTGASITLGGTSLDPAPPGTFVRVGDTMIFPPIPGPAPVALQPGAPRGTVGTP